MTIAIDRLRALIEHALAHVSDARIVDHIRLALVEPHVEMRSWDYGEPGEQYACWLVLVDPSDPAAGIAYCEQGFGPRCPWGLVWLGDDDGSGRRSLGMDADWFPTFLQAFFNSLTSQALAIWQVFEPDPETGEPKVAVTGELAWDAARKRCAELRSARPHIRHVVSQPLALQDC